MIIDVYNEVVEDLILGNLFCEKWVFSLGRLKTKDLETKPPMTSKDLVACFALFDPCAASGHCHVITR